MLRENKNPVNKQVIIYVGQSNNGLLVKVIQNTLPNCKRSKFFVQTTVKRGNDLKNKIVAKSNDIRKVSELLSNLIGRKISLR